MDENYINLVASLLEGDNGTQSNSYMDSLSGSESTDNLFASANVVDSDDFLPMPPDFLVRDRAFSWDLSLESNIHDLDILHSVHNAVAMSNGQKFPNIIMPGKSFNSDISDNPLKSEFYSNSNPSDCVDLHSLSGSLPMRKRTYSEEFKSIVGSCVDNVRGYLTTIPTTLSIFPEQEIAPSQEIPTIQDRPLALDRTHFISYDEDRPDGRIGAYTKEERKAIIEKFRAKKLKRVWRKQIKYDCRKRLADTRPRVKGRFVSRKEDDIDFIDSDMGHADADDDDSMSGMRLDERPSKMKIRTLSSLRNNASEAF